MSALNVGQNAWIAAVSCASAGNCAAGGTYSAGSGVQRAFVADEVNGAWHTPQRVTGLSDLDNALGAEIDSLSCPSAGNCAAGGRYRDSLSQPFQLFVVNEVNGVWGKPQPVPVSVNLDSAFPGIWHVSCVSAGNCSAVGSYNDASSIGQVFAVDEVNGAWGSPQQIASDVPQAGPSFLDSLSCPSAGDCTASGYYLTSGYQAFIVEEVNGAWGKAEPVPGLAALNVGDSARVWLSCPKAGYCGAIGYYTDSAGAQPAFVLDEVNGAWGNPQQVPGLPALSGLYRNTTAQVSCPSAGNCGGAGEYTGNSGHAQVFVVSEVNGAWGDAQQLHRAADIPATSNLRLSSLSCPSAGTCGAAGSYDDSSALQHVFVVDEVNGAWGDAQPVPGMAALNARDAGFGHLSCPAVGVCTVGGWYFGLSGRQPFVAHEPVVATTTSMTLSASTVTYGDEQAAQISVAVSPASGGGTPTGTVTVSVPAAAAAVCTITLVSGAGSCSLAARQLEPGAYQVAASYSGDADYAPSVSPAQALTVKPDTVTVTSPGPQTTVAGGPVDLQIQGSDAAGLTLSYTATGLPPGVSISSTGLLTGWPESLGTYQATVSASDSPQGQGSGSATFSWSVSAAPDTGPAGHLRVQSGGKCLHDVRNRTRNGNPVDIWTCHSAWTSQRWTLAQDQTIRIHGKCLTAPKHTGWKARLQPCTGWASRRWELAYPRHVRPSAGARPLALYNPASGLCLAEPGWNQPNGARVVMQRCDGYTNQVWTPPAGPLTSEVAGKCADDAGGHSYNTNKIQIWDCNGQARQRWHPKPDGTIRIHGKCLTIAHNGRAPGSLIWLYTCWGGPNQQWHIIPAAGGAHLLNPASGLCLTDPASSTTNGTQLVIDPCTNPPPGNNWRLR